MKQTTQFTEPNRNQKTIHKHYEPENQRWLAECVKTKSNRIKSNRTSFFFLPWVCFKCHLSTKNGIIRGFFLILMILKSFNFQIWAKFQKKNKQQQQQKSFKRFDHMIFLMTKTILLIIIIIIQNQSKQKKNEDIYLVFHFHISFHELLVCHRHFYLYNSCIHFQLKLLLMFFFLKKKKTTNISIAIQ